MEENSDLITLYDCSVLNSPKTPKIKINPIWEETISLIYQLRDKGLSYSEIAVGIDKDKSYRSSIWHFQKRVLMLKSSKKQIELNDALKNLVKKLAEGKANARKKLKGGNL